MKRNYLASGPLGQRDEALLQEGSCAHYREPSYYTKCYASRAEDVAFYVKLARSKPSRVLEYGCGNGRIALPLASVGHEVVGVDLSTAMLDDFRQRLAKAPVETQRRLRLVHGDMRSVRLRKRFDLVLCTFNTFLHLYDRHDVEEFLRLVRAHLASDGRFAFDVSVPIAAELARDPTRAYRIPRLRYPSTGQMVRYAEYFDYEPLTQVLRVTMRFEPMDGGGKAWDTVLTHRQFYPGELEALLHYNGFEVEHVLADFTFVPADRDTDTAVWIARATKA